MVQQKQGRGAYARSRTTQRGCFLLVLVRPCELRGKGPGAIGDADSALLGVAAFLLFQGAWFCVRRVGGEISGLVRDTRQPSAALCFDQGRKVTFADMESVFVLSTVTYIA